MNKLSHAVQEFALLEGAAAAGIATTETLAGGPPSADLTYVLAEAKSAISFAVGLDKKTFPAYLTKKDRLSFEREMVRANVTASGIALHLANYLKNKGYDSIPVAANLVFRPTEDGSKSYDPTDPVYPDVAHRYLAVRSGLGHLGRSGNFLHPDLGAAVILGAVVTEADLNPTFPLPAEDNYCDDCRLCLAACASEFMDFSKETRVNLGGLELVYSARRNLARCDLVCSGYTGLSPNGKWSTWSPGRFRIPENTSDIPDAYARIERAYSKWPKAPGGRIFYYTDDRLRVCCANCQLMCTPDRDERKERYRMLTQSGVVVQRENGELESVSPQEAEHLLASMPPERRALYQ